MSESVSSNTFKLPSKSDVTVSYGAVFGALLVIYLIFNFFWGNRIPMTFSQLVGTTQVLPGLAKVWFIFVWAAVVTLGIVLIRALLGRTLYLDDSRDSFLVRGWWLSLNAGVFEELIYRWLIFFCAMLLLQVLNFVTFGLVWQAYTNIFLPLTNTETLGALAPQLLGTNWVIGAGISIAAARFQEDHQYQGWFGAINAWFIGMILFYVMFHYGIITAVVVHVLYDAVVFTVNAILLKSDRSANI